MVAEACRYRTLWHSTRWLWRGVDINLDDLSKLSLISLHSLIFRIFCLLSCTISNLDKIASKLLVQFQEAEKFTISVVGKIGRILPLKSEVCEMPSQRYERVSLQFRFLLELQSGPPLCHCLASSSHPRLKIFE